MEVKDSLKAREMYSDFRKRKRKGRKEGRSFLFQWRGSLEARRYKKEREKNKDVGVSFGGKKDNSSSFGFLLRILEKNHSWKSSELSQGCWVRFLLFFVFPFTFYPPLFSGHF